MRAIVIVNFFFFFSSRRRHTRFDCDWSSDVCSSDLVLAEKDVEFEAIEIDLADRPAWIYEKNSTGRVPVVEEDAWVLPESAVIMEYLEERYPGPPLLAPDPADRALARLWIFRHDEFTKPYYALRRGEEGAAERLDAELAKPDAAAEARQWLGGRAHALAE